MISAVIKAALLLFIAVLVQVSLASAYTILGGNADLPLVILTAVALLRGSIFGAVAGFCTGLLLDTTTLSALGFTSLLLTLAGFAIGRYGETTGGERFHAPLVSIAVATVLVGLGALVLQFVLGESVPASTVLSGLPAAVLLNTVLAWLLFRPVRMLIPRSELSDRIHEVRLVA